MKLQLLRDGLRRFFLMHETIVDVDQHAATVGQAGAANARMARALVGAAESFDNAAELQLGAITLLREALVFGAQGLAMRHQLLKEAADAATSWNAVLELPKVRQLWESLSADTRARTQKLIIHGISVDFDHWSSSERRGLRDVLLRVARHVIVDLEDDLLAPKRIRTQRLLRWVFVAGLLTFALAWGIREFRESRVSGNLALGRRVTISSSWRADIYPPERLVDGDTTQLGCHSENQPNPWVTVDLGRSRRIHRVVVTNRLDGLTERAVPLLVETSVDGQKFTEYARRTADFNTWTATAPTVKARYVRLTVLGSSILHLNEVEIY